MEDSNKREKRVLHISKYYYPYLGGTESVCQDIVEGLKEYENRLYVLMILIGLFVVK